MKRIRRIEWKGGLDQAWMGIMNEQERKKRKEKKRLDDGIQCDAGVRRDVAVFECACA